MPNIFTHFDSPNEKIKSRLKMLQDETLHHVERIKQTQKEAIDFSRQ